MNMRLVQERFYYFICDLSCFVDTWQRQVKGPVESKNRAGKLALNVFN